MLYELHRILKQEHELLSSLQEEDDETTGVRTVASTKPRTVWDELLEAVRPKQARMMKSKIRTHMKKIERVKNVQTNNIEGYFKGMELLKRDEITKALKGPKTNDTIKLIETKLADIPIEVKKEAVNELGPTNALKLFIRAVMSTANIGISVVQGAAILCVVACIIQVFTVPPMKSMEQRLYGMVTTGDFLENAHGNWLTEFAQAATFQGNSLFLSAEDKYLQIPDIIPRTIRTMTGDFKLVDLTTIADDFTGLNLSSSVQTIGIPLTSTTLLLQLQSYSKLEREIRRELGNAEARAEATKTIKREAQHALIDTVIDTGFLIVDAPKEVTKLSLKAFVRAVRVFGSNFINGLLNNKVNIMIDATVAARKYGIAMAKEQLRYQERMNEGIALMIDSIVSSLILSALLKAAAYLAELTEWKKMSTVWTAVEMANRYYRIANVFIYSFLLTMVDTGLNEGIDLLASYTGITMLKHIQVGHVAALTIVNSCNACYTVISVFEDSKTLGLKTIRLVGNTAKKMLNGQRDNTEILRVSYKKRRVSDEFKLREMSIMSKNSTIEERRKIQLEFRKRQLIHQIINYQP